MTTLLRAAIAVVLLCLPRLAAGQPGEQLVGAGAPPPIRPTLAGLPSCPAVGIGTRFRVTDQAGKVYRCDSSGWVDEAATTSDLGDAATYSETTPSDWSTWTDGLPTTIRNGLDRLGAWVRGMRTVVITPNMTRAQIEAAILSTCHVTSDGNRRHTCGRVVFTPGNQSVGDYTWTKPIRICPDVNGDNVPDCSPATGIGSIWGLKIEAVGGRARFNWGSSASGMGTGGDPEGDIFGPSGKSLFILAGVRNAQIDLRNVEINMDASSSRASAATHVVALLGANGSCAGGTRANEPCTVSGDCPGSTCTTANSRTNLYNQIQLGHVFGSNGHAVLVGSYPTTVACTTSSTCTSAFSSSYYCYASDTTDYESGGFGRCMQNSQGEGTLIQANAIRHSSGTVRTGGVVSVQNDQTQNTLVTHANIGQLGDNASAYRVSRGYLTVLHSDMAAMGSLGNPTWGLRTAPWLGQSNSQCRNLNLLNFRVEGPFANGVEITHAGERCTTTIGLIENVRTAGGNDAEPLVPLRVDATGSVSWQTILARPASGNPNILVDIQNNVGAGTVLEVNAGNTILEGGSGTKTVSIERPGSDAADGDVQLGVPVQWNGSTLWADLDFDRVVDAGEHLDRKPWEAAGFFDDYTVCLNNSGAGQFFADLPWQMAATGTGATSASNGDGNVTNCTVETGTTATGTYGMRRGHNVLRARPLDRFEARLRIHTLSNSTDEYDFGVGFTDSYDQNPVDAILIFYDRNTSTNWQGRLCAASSCTTVDLGVAVSTTVVRLGYEINAAGTSVQFFIDGTAAGAPQTTNIPSAAGGVAAWILKSAGTTNRFVFLDYIGLWRPVR